MLISNKNVQYNASQPPNHDFNEQNAILICFIWGEKPS